MKKRFLARAVALCLSVFLLTGCTVTDVVWQWTLGQVTNPGTSGGFSTRETTGERVTIPYDEMEYTRPDVDALKARIEEVTPEISGITSFYALMEYDYEIGTAVSEFLTMSDLAYLRSLQNKNDAFYKEESEFCQQARNSVMLSYNTFIRAVLDGPLAEDYRSLAGEYLYNSILNSLMLSSAEVEPLQQRRKELTNEYVRALDEIDMDSIDENAPRFAEIYAEMINLDKEIAEKLGYESAMDMYYSSYSRDYTPEDAREYFTYAKELFVPLFLEALDYIPPRERFPKATALEAMPVAVGKVSPDLGAAWQHMMTYGLYDFDNSPDKIDNGSAFTLTLYQYDAPFIYIGSWDESSFDTNITLMHEFGHYFESWLHFDAASSNSLDVAEIYSQALELLLQEQFGLFTNDVESAKKTQLKNSLNALTYQAMLEEFQFEAYALEEVNADTLGELHGRLLEEYRFNETGMGSYTDENGRNNLWYTVTHLFEVPFYTISYWTSAVAALQIWSVSLDDWQQGVDLYLDLLNADQERDFLELTESVGLLPPDNEEVLLTIAEDIAGVFDIDLASLPAAA